jgi:hypothetical protein
MEVLEARWIGSPSFGWGVEKGRLDYVSYKVVRVHTLALNPPQIHIYVRDSQQSKSASAQLT